MRVMTHRPATETQKRILARAARHTLGILECPPDFDVRLWMSQLTQMSKKGYICREDRVAYITDVGRQALTKPVNRQRTAAALFWERVRYAASVQA